MAVTFTSVKCPDCGATLQIEEGRQQIFCSYCGAKVIMTNENEYIYRHIDEADIKKAETDRMVKLRQLELAEKNNAQTSWLRKILLVVWLILTIIITSICIIKIGVQDDFVTGFLMLFYLGGPVICGGGAFLFKVLPGKEQDRIALQHGGVRFPKGMEPFSDKGYQFIENSLRHAGFSNITCINEHDLTLGLLQKPGKVDKVTINGEDITSGGRVYPAETPIVISYHGK